MSTLSQTRTVRPRVSSTRFQLAFSQALTFRLCAQLMDKVESSAQFEVARLSKRKRIVHQPDTVSQREY
jgi:hypothetical protein